MSNLTRDLSSYAISRAASQSMTLIFSDKTSAGDGSYTETRRHKEYKAHVTDLSRANIQRLQDKGVTVHEGFTCALPVLLVQIPERAIFDGFKCTVVDYVDNEGMTVLTLSKQGMGNDQT